MRIQLYSRLCAIARRHCGQEAEDVVQEALLAAVRAGRTDLGDAATAHWLSGVVRNQARMVARGAGRRRRRDGDWHDRQSRVAGPVGRVDLPVVAEMPTALRALASLALSGHSRREIAYLLNLTDTSLRQRIVALKRHLKARGLAMPAEFVGLNLDLADGRIREALQAELRRIGGLLGSHDPDGHIFVVRRSQIG